MTRATSETITTAQKAFEQFAYGLATGEWNAFLDMLADDFTFWFPVGPYQGWNVGKERASAFFEYVSEAFDTGLKVTLESIASNEKTAIFEMRTEGLLRGKPYQNQVAVSFDVCGDKICCYREYLAVIVPPTAKD
jgi:ketosteroid isomerase-like protein